LVNGVDDDKADFLWAIYFDKSEIPGCYTLDEIKGINGINLKERHFFDLDEEMKKRN